MYSAQTDNKPVNRSQGSLVSLVCLVFLSPPAPLLSKISIDLQNFVKFRKPCQICQSSNWSRSCFVSEVNASKQENQGRAPLSTATPLHFAASSSPPSPPPTPVHQQRQQRPLQVKHRPTKGEGAQGVGDKQGPGAWQWTWLMAETLDKCRDWMYGGGALGNCNTEASSGWSGY